MLTLNSGNIHVFGFFCTIFLGLNQFPEIFSTSALCFSLISCSFYRLFFESLPLLTKLYHCSTDARSVPKWVVWCRPKQHTISLNSTPQILRFDSEHRWLCPCVLASYWYWDWRIPKGHWSSIFLMLSPISMSECLAESADVNCSRLSLFSLRTSSSC